MKIVQAHIRNFKGVAELDIDFRSAAANEPRSLTTLIGDNGSGKTSVLQAIALTLSLATRRTKDPASLRWHGFLAERVGSLGATYVKLTVRLDHEEIRATSELFERWHRSHPSEWSESRRTVRPSELKEIDLVYEGGKVFSPQGPEAVNQFLGRHYIKTLLQTERETRSLFPPLGDVFWFDQDRNIGSVVREHEEHSPRRAASAGGWEAGVEQLREFLVGWWGYHTSGTRKAGKDYIQALEREFSRLFAGTKFIGIEPRENIEEPSARDFYFLLKRDGRVYDLAELSSGEQAIFPLLYEFVRLDIARSVVLIDELELHLHPPEQQSLLGALRRIGPDCQFIITTHSEYLTDVIPEEEEVRLPGGRRCL